MSLAWNFDRGYDYDEDRREDARIEMLEDKFDRAAVTCAECGERWNPGAHRATRIDPAYADQPECPACGGAPEGGSL